MHAGLHWPLLGFLLIGMDQFRGWRGVPWKLTSSPECASRAMCLLPSGSLKRLESAACKSGVVILLFASLHPLLTLNPTSSWLQWLRQPPAFTTLTNSSFFVRLKLSKASLLINLSVTCVRHFSSIHFKNLDWCHLCCVVPPANVVIEVKHKDLWMWSFFQ